MFSHQPSTTTVKNNKYQYIVQRSVLGNGHGWLNIVVVSVEFRTATVGNGHIISCLVSVSDR